MGSTRLPGKSMRLLGNRPVIQNVIERMKRARCLSEVVMATSVDPIDDVLAELAEQLGVLVFRGSEEDVLGRFIKAAEERRSDMVVRMCADRPLVAPEEIDRIVRHHIATDADYSFNHIPSSNGYPIGLGAEILSYETLKRIGEITDKPRHREHVTIYIWDHPEAYRIETVDAPPEIAGSNIKLDLDTEEDLDRLNSIFMAIPGDPVECQAVEIVDIYRKLFG